MTFADLLYKLFAYLYNNKQSILGGLVAALAFIQANDNLQNLLSPTVYEWTMMVVGLLMVVFARSASGGAVVSKVLPPAVPPAKNTEAGFARPSMLLALMLALSPVAVLPLTGCSFFNVQTPSNFDERVVAGYKLVEVAADLVAEVHSAGKLSQADANAALDKVQQASDGIGIAVDLKNSGDFTNAETRLTATISALELLQAQLKAK